MKPQKQTIHGPLKRELREGDQYVDLAVMKEVPVYCGKEPMQGRVREATAALGKAGWDST